MIRVLILIKKKRLIFLDSTGTNDKGANDLDKEKKDDYVNSSSDMNVNGAVLNNHGSSSKLKPNSEDPFRIYELLNRNKNKQDSKSEDPIFPPGFTLNVVEDTDVENLEHSINQPNDSLSSNMEGTSRAKSGSNRSLQLKPGGSILDVMEGLVEVGQNMGYNMEGCFKHIDAPSLIPKETFRFIRRKNLWEYISHMIDLWDGECVILGDFNEVRSEHERFGTMFNALGANAFNHFISLAGLVDLPFEDMIQKAKIRWAIEEDENSKYFHGIISKKRSQLAIRGVLVDGNVDLESNVTYEEIKKVIWDCANNKSLGPDGFTFDFFHKYWKTIDQDVVNAVQDFFITSKFPPGSNSTFITLIPKKQDAKW
ncbi:hypothetical protein Tco_1285473 [Tanacetum coccineum]